MTTVQFVVRYVNGLKDTIIQLDTHANPGMVNNVPIGYIRNEIRKMYPELAKKRLKLLHNGRVLESHTNFSKEIAYLQKNLDEDNGVNDHNPKEKVNIYFHCIIGDDLTEKEVAEEEKLDQQPIKSTTDAPKGFDRLLSQGFSASDIQDLRDQFFRLHGANLPRNATQEQITELEDRWIDSSVNNEIDEFPANIRLSTSDPAGDASNVDGDDDGRNGVNANVNSNSNTNMVNVRQLMFQQNLQSHKDMFFAVCIGFALGGLALLLLFLDVGGIFDKKTRIAVLSGVVVNLSFGLLHSWGG